MEIASSGIESQNATRQPILENVAGSMLMRQMRMTASAASIPTVAVVWIQLVA